jgi:hypothetical protein
MTAGRSVVSWHWLQRLQNNRVRCTGRMFSDAPTVLRAHHACGHDMAYIPPFAPPPAAHHTDMTAQATRPQHGEIVLENWQLLRRQA